jgi:hypothetical protein
MVQTKKAVKSVKKATEVAKVANKTVVAKTKNVAKPIWDKSEVKVAPVLVPKAKAVKKVVLTPVLPAKDKALPKEEVKKVAKEKVNNNRHLTEKARSYWEDTTNIEFTLPQRIVVGLNVLAKKEGLSLKEYIKNLLLKPFELFPHLKKSKAKK